MDKLGIIVFIVGIGVSICAFVADKVDHIPGILRLLAPEYARAEAALAKLRNTKTLEPGDKGFSEVSKLFFQTAARENPPELLATLSITKLTRQNAMMAFGETQVGEIVPLEVELSNGQKVRWDLKQVEAQAASLKEIRIFHFSVAFFIVGIIIAAIGFLTDHVGHNRTKAEAEKSLRQLATFATEPRGVNFDKAKEILQQGAKGSVEIAPLDGNVEANALADYLQLIFSKNGWRVSRRKAGADEIVNAGIAVVTGSRSDGTIDKEGLLQLDDPAKTLRVVLRTCITDNARGGSFRTDSRMTKDASLILIGPKY